MNVYRLRGILLYSTLNTMLHKTYVPTVPLLMKICNGFGITIAQFFTEEDETARLTAIRGKVSTSGASWMM